MKNESIEFETLKRNKKRIYFLCGFVCAVILLIVLITNNSLAKYRIIESIPLVNGTINYTPYDLKMVAMYQEENGDYESIDIVPTSGYSLNEKKSYCKVNGEKDESMKLSYDSTTRGLSVTPMTAKGTKCYLYFDEQPILLVDAIKRDNTINSGTPDFSSVAITDEGVYKTEDDWGESYYFRGAVNNNWVRFAGYYWRIIRINGDESIRLIYNGTTTNTTGNDTVIGNSAFNSNNNKSEYVGYMYTSGEQHGNTTNSPIKTIIDNWYSSNLASYADKISKEAGFCGDREMASGYSWSSQPSSTIYYAGYGRLVQNSSSVNPTFKCSNSNDLYTTSTSSKGNKKLSNPIGLITVDEVVMAGGAWNSGNSSYYLYNNAAYWTMSPFYFNVGSGGSWAIMFGVRSTGYLDAPDVSNAGGVRPVINLARDVEITGSGTSSAPYVVVA